MRTSVKVAKIDSAVKVRSGGLREERLQFFKGIHDGGGNLGDLLLWEKPDGNFELLGGNHRLHVLRNSGVIEVMAEVIDNPDLSETARYLLAIANNPAGTQPYDRDDLILQVRQLLSMKLTTKEILSAFPHLPPNTVADALKNVRAMAHKAAVARAVKKVLDPLRPWSVQRAAESEGVEPSQVRNAMRPEGERKASVLDIKTAMSAHGAVVGTVSRSFSSWYKKAEIEVVTNEGLGKDAMKKIMTHQKTLLLNALRDCREREDRLAKIVG